MIKESYQHSALTATIIGAAMKVHRHLGLGFPEILYHKALIRELSVIGLMVSSEVEKAVYYEGVLLGKRRLDLVVEDKVLIEIKAGSELTSSAVA
ncbi:MAG TPA: GxxExxY protein [Chitinophagaceae bacterium]|jgi:GxxExxY protein|nr:GxxExxY protein [Chitinophagaceae bacterium]